MRERPDAIAVEMARRALTYREVDARANALAHAVAGRGIGRDAIVGILLDPCIEMLVAVLGVMKAGAAFLPIDPDVSDRAQGAHVRDSGDARAGDARHARRRARAIDAEPSIDRSRAACRAPSRVDEPTSRRDDLAYVIYTSGSTGDAEGHADRAPQPAQFRRLVRGLLRDRAGRRRVEVRRVRLRRVDRRDRAPRSSRARGS